MMFLLNIKSEYIMNKYSEIWDRIKWFIGKDLDVEVFHKNKYITTKIKPYKNEIKTDFHDERLHIFNIFTNTYINTCILKYF